MDIIQPGQLESYKNEDGKYLDLKLVGQDASIETKLLVGSDGSKSKVKEIS